LGIRTTDQPHIEIKLPRPRCEKEGFCQQRDWEGRCLDPERECEWNEVVRILARRLKRDPQ